MNLKTWRLYVFVVEFAVVVPVFGQTPLPTTTPLTINQTNVPIRVDGHLNDWPEARMIYLGLKDQVVLGKNFWKGEDDFNGRVFVTYDEQYLYVAAIVQKAGSVVDTVNLSALQKSNNVVNASDLRSLWNGDCLELFFSTRSELVSPSHLAKGDYHIGLSPGADCKSPLMYCFNRDETISGSRLVARKTLKGYLMEACIPLAYFQGLDLGAGKPLRLDAALDKGGALSGYRIVELDYAGKGSDPEDPSTWPRAQWIGKIEQAVPFEQSEDLYAELVHDGTRGATYGGIKTIAGVALDAAGKPLSGVLVSTWPKTQQTRTDSQGTFQLPKIKIYDKTVFYGRLNGNVVSVSPLELHAKAVTLRLSPLPAGFGSSLVSVSPFFFGQSIPPGSAEQFDTLAPLLNPLNPGLIRLNLSASQPDLEDRETLLDHFAVYARKIGAETMVVVPINRADLEGPAQWVHYANVVKNYNIRFWAVGDEPDMGVKGVENYNAYDYVNDFRILYNAMKREDPSIIVLGPEAASKYSRDENDWISSFLRYNGDIVEGISIHRYASFQAANLPVSIRVDLRQEDSLVQALRDKIYQNTDFDLPLLVTGESACAAAVISTTKEAGVTIQMWEALWEADKKGEFLNKHLAMDASSYSWRGASAGVSFQALPSYWALKLWGQMIHGKVVPAQIQNPEMSVYATQDPKSKDVTLMIINKGDRYWRPKTLLNGSDAELSVEAGLDQRYDFEIPSYSISLLKIKGNRSAGEALVYMLKMALAGQEPKSSVIKPW